MRTKIAFVVGHHENSKGAFSKHLNSSEWDFYNKVVNSLGDVSFFHNDKNIRSYTERIKNTASKINKYPFDLVIELHFNSVNDERVSGCETLFYHSSTNGKKYAQLFSDTISELTGIKKRNNGLKPLSNSNDRGFASVYYTTAPTILIEPFFGSNESDCEKIQSPENMACLINEFIDRL